MDIDLAQLGQTYGIWGSIILFTIFLTFQTIKDILKNKREKIKNIASSIFSTQVSAQMTENSAVNNQILKYLKQISQEFVDEITESQARILSDSIFDGSKYYLIDEMARIMRENHIRGNEKEVSAKIKQITQNRFHKDTLSFKDYKINKKLMSSEMKDKWKDYIIKNCTDIIIKEKGEKILFSTISNAFNGFKCEFQDAFF